MSRYVEADALKDKKFHDVEKVLNNDSARIYMRGWNDAIDAIVENEPTVDVVEVVRCKNCSKKEYCRTANVWASPPSDNWFCADGERKTTMTNREYLETLSDNELAKYIVHKLQNIWMQYNNSELGLSSWLAEERREDDKKRSD